MLQAVTEGARVVNASLSTNNLVDLNNFLYARPLRKAMSSGDEVLFAFAAGNNGMDYKLVAPASLALEFSNAIAVGGTDKTRKRFRSGNESSNFGEGLLYAPGDSVPTICTFCAGGYTSFFGWTSAAAPFVSSVAGLMLSRDSNLTGSELKRRLFLSADCTIGQDATLNGGRILDAFAAVEIADKEITELIAGVDGSHNALPKGSADPFTTHTSPSGVGQAIVSSGAPGGSFVEGGTVCGKRSQQIATASPYDIEATFRRAFQLPVGFSSPVLRLWVVADDGARIFLNGHELPTTNLLEGPWGFGPGGVFPLCSQVSLPECPERSIHRATGFPALIEVREENCPGCFEEGPNTLEFHVVNHPFPPSPGTYGVPQGKGGDGDAMNLEYEGYVAFNR